MSKVHCVFCDCTRKRAREHVWPLWLQEFFSEVGEVRAETHLAFTGGTVSRRVQTGRSLVLGKVCEPCNGGWMSRLESETAAIVLPLLRLPDVCRGQLTAEQSRTLALWAFKTTIVRNLGTNYRRIVPASHFSACSRPSVRPRGLFVDLAVSPGHTGLNALQSQSIMGLSQPEDEDRFASALRNVYNVVLAVGPLFLRVVHLPLRGYWLFPGVGRDAPCSVRLHPGPEAVSLGTGVFTGTLWDFESEAHFRAVTLSE